MDVSGGQTYISVRADARREVEPDLASVHVRAETVAASRAESRETTARHLQQVTDALAVLGGAVRTTDNVRAALTWSAHGISTFTDRGQYHSSVALSVHLRDLAMLPAFERALEAVDGTNLAGVTWGVDDDNPVWPQVRADAIAGALRKAADYAEALGGQLRSLEHVADVGLLGGAENGPGGVREARAASGVAVGRMSGEGGTTIDPVPQVVVAAIEGRFVATVGVIVPR